MAKFGLGSINKKELEKSRGLGSVSTKESDFIKRLGSILDKDIKSREAKSVPPYTAELYSQDSGHKYFDKFHNRRKPLSKLPKEK